MERRSVGSGRSRAARAATFTAAACISASPCSAMRKGAVAAVAGLGLVLLATGILLGCYGFPALVHEQIKNMVVLRDDSAAYRRWEKLPQPISFRVYIFNVTNAEEVRLGARPVLNELGPYHYDQYREHINVVDVPKEEALLYQQKSFFVFNKDKSGGAESDNVTILNMALVGTAQKVKQMMPMGLSMMNPILKEVFPGGDSPFFSATVGDVLFGGVTVIDCLDSANMSSMARMVCSQAQNYVPRTVRFEEPGLFQFAMFGYKNGTEGWFKVKRGITNSSDLGRLLEWNNATSLSTWHGPGCNAINGTDSTIFPPFVDRRDSIYIFATDLCRSFHAVYEHDSTVEGIKCYRFVADKHLLQSGNTYDANKCFCSKECLEDGVVDLSTCHDAPVVASFPHFYLGSDTYRNYPIGMEPKKELHQTFMDIEPNGGAPMRGRKRVQMNMFLQKIPQLDALKTVSEGLFPVLWIEEGAEIEGDNLLLVQGAYKKLDTLDAVKWVIVGVAVSVLVLALLLYRGRHGSALGSCCAVRQSNRITTVTASPPQHFAISTIDGLMRRDTARDGLPAGITTAHAYPANGDAPYKYPSSDIFK